RLRQRRDQVRVEPLVGDEIGADAQRGRVGVRDRWIAPERAERDVEAFIGAFDVGNGAGGLDRDHGRKSIAAVAKETPHQRQVFFIEGDDYQERAGFLCLDRAWHLRWREILEDDLAGEVILLRQGIDDLPVDLAADQADRVALYFLDAGHRQSRQ